MSVQSVGVSARRQPAPGGPGTVAGYPRESTPVGVFRPSVVQRLDSGPGRSVTGRVSRWMAG